MTCIKGGIIQLLRHNVKLNLFESSKSIHTASIIYGRYGHRLVKKWEKKEYTIEPLHVYRTGGRMPVKSRDGNIVPGKKWSAKLGGGLDRKWYWIDANRLTENEVKNQVIYQEKILKIMEDDNRSGYIALAVGPNKRRWILATDGMKVGDLVTNCGDANCKETMKPGDACPVGILPTGTEVCSVEFRPGKGAQIARSAGAKCTVVKHRELSNTVLQMPSKREIAVDPDCIAVVGRVSNTAHNKEKWGSAARSREFGIRPDSGLKQRPDGRSGRKINPIKRRVVVRPQNSENKNVFDDE